MSSSIIRLMIVRGWLITPSPVCISFFRFAFIQFNLCIYVGFSPANSPHLTPALELDTAMLELSASLAAKGLPTSISSAQDVEALVGAFRGVVTDLKLWQYYVLDVAREKESVKSALVSGKVTPWTGVDVARKSVVELAEILIAAGSVIGRGALGSRFGVRVDSAVAAGFVKAAFVDLGEDAEKLVEAWVRVVDVLNVPLYEEAEGDMKTAIESVKNRIEYTRLDAHGPKLGEITRK